MINESLTRFPAGIMGNLFVHTVKLLNVRLSALLHLGPKLRHFPQDLHSAQPSQSFFFLPLGKTFDTDVKTSRGLF